MPNTTDYVHPSEPNLRGLQHAMDYNQAGEPIIRTSGGSHDYTINISAGAVDGVSNIHKFGRNPSVGGAPETIWEQGGVYTYLTVASTVYVSGADAQDGAAGTGARTVTVQGLDASYNAIEETLTVDGAVSQNSFLRVYRAFVASAGSLQTNKGNVLISTGASGGGTVLAKIATIGTGTVFGQGQTNLALYTIPAGTTGFLTNWNIGVGAYNDAVTANLYTREVGNGLIFRTRDVMDVPGGLHQRIYQVPFALPEKTDIEVRAIASTGTNISSTFDILLYDTPRTL